MVLLNTKEAFFEWHYWYCGKLEKSHRTFPFQVVFILNRWSELKLNLNGFIEHEIIIESNMANVCTATIFICITFDYILFLNSSPVFFLLSFSFQKLRRWIKLHVFFCIFIAMPCKVKVSRKIRAMNFSSLTTFADFGLMCRCVWYRKDFGLG